jgi:hypothetical protein
LLGEAAVPEKAGTEATAGAGKTQAKRAGTDATRRDNGAAKAKSTGNSNLAVVAPDAPAVGAAKTEASWKAGAGEGKSGRAKSADEAGAVKGSGKAAGVSDATGGPSALGSLWLLQPAAVVTPSAAPATAEEKPGRMGFGGTAVTAAESKTSAGEAAGGRGKSAARTAESGATSVETQGDDSGEEQPMDAGQKTPAMREIAPAVQGENTADGASGLAGTASRAAGYGSHSGAGSGQERSARNAEAGNPVQPDAAPASAQGSAPVVERGSGSRVQAASGAAKSARTIGEGPAGTAFAGISGNAATSASAHVPVSAGNAAARGLEAGQSGTAATNARDPFAAIDEESVTPAPTWIRAGAQHAEAGYLDPALGWVGVRAEAAGSTVHAAIVPGSAEAATALSGHLSALPAYLSEHHGQTASVTLAAPENGFGAAGQGQAGTGAGQDRAPGEPGGGERNATPAGAGSDVRRAASAPQTEPAAMARTAGTGELISVIA